MTEWSFQNIHTSMRVYTLDGYELGHIANAYEDPFYHQFTGLPWHSRYPSYYCYKARMKNQRNI